MSKKQRTLVYSTCVTTVSPLLEDFGLISSFSVVSDPADLGSCLGSEGCYTEKI